MEKLIITVATTGSGTPLSKCPNLAITPEQIAEEVYQCYLAGASVAHIHVRDEQGGRSMDFARFKETVERIRDKCDILINLTTSGMEFSEKVRLKPLELRPDLASFNAGSMNFGEGIFINKEDMMKRFAQAMREYHVKPEIECYDAGMVENSLRLHREGFLSGPLHYQFVLGVKGGMAATERNLLFLAESIPADATWGAVGLGRQALTISTMAIHMGGNLRVGMEDNIYIRKGILAEHNVEFVDRIKRIADEFERPLATVGDARRILGLDEVWA